MIVVTRTVMTAVVVSIGVFGTVMFVVIAFYIWIISEIFWLLVTLWIF